MRSVCFSLVKNEEDIIEAFVRHTLSQVDHLYIMDNLSTDGTREILDALGAEGLPITVSDDIEQALVQNEKMTAMYRKWARDTEIDFAFFLDADEFLHLDKDLMLTVWSRSGRGRAYYLPRINYLYSDETAPHDPLSVFSVMRVTDNQPEDPKSMIFHGNEECRRFRVGNGNHHIRDWARDGAIVSEDQPALFASISHFPIRSVNQYLRKSLLGWLALMLREPGVNDASKTIGSHWRAQFRLIMAQGGEITPPQLRENLYGDHYIARQGPVLPFHFSEELKYTHLLRHPPVLVQLVEMYSMTIDQMWRERESWCSMPKTKPE